MVKQIGGDPAGSGLDYFKDFAPGGVIFEQGATGDEMFIIQEGQVEIVHHREGAADERLAVLETGDFFGEMAVLEGEPRTATARALTQCRVLPVSGSTFTKMLQGNPEIAVRMMRKLSSRLRAVGALSSGGTRAAEVSEAPPPAAPAPAAQSAAAATGTLVHEATGTRLPLASGELTTVGRPDSAAGTVPDIDLTPLNEDRTVSRRHARIVRRDGRLFVVEETGTMNGTFVNGQRVETGKETEFEAGAELGFGAVKLRFEP